MIWWAANPKEDYNSGIADLTNALGDKYAWHGLTSEPGSPAPRSPANTNGRRPRNSGFDQDHKRGPFVGRCLIQHLKVSSSDDLTR